MGSDDSSDQTERGHTRVQWLVVIIASMTLMTYGLQTGWISPMTRVLQSELSPTGYPLSDSEMSWLSSSMALIAVCGVPLYAYIADAYGRKVGVLAVAFPQVLCWVMKLTATNTTVLIIARLVAGLPAGGCFNVLPLYIREIGQANMRGAMVSSCLLMQNVGLLSMYIIGTYLDYYTVLWISLCVGAVPAVAMLFAPESPAYLVKREKLDEAAKTIAFLRGLEVNNKVVQLEVDTMRSEELHYSSLPKLTFVTIFKNRAWRRGFLRIMLIITAQASSGSYAFMTYAYVIFSTLGVTLDPNLQSLVVPSLLICGSLVSLVCVQRVGRKMLLVATYMLSFAALVCLGVVFLLQHYGYNIPSWVGMAAVATSVWAYSAGVTPAFYVVMSEIFNFQVRSKLIGCIVSHGWFTSSMQLVLFMPICEAFGMYTVFFMYAGVNLFGAIATLVLLPETKGKTVEEIEEILSR